MIREGLRVERGHKKCRVLAPPVTGKLLVSRAGGGGRKEGEGRSMACLYLACYSSCWHLAGRRDIERQLDKRGARRTGQDQSYPECHPRRLCSLIGHEEVPRETGS